jgi:rhamnose transport system ATP-binding protein
MTRNHQSAENELQLRASHIGKSFGSVVALADVDLELRRGEVHALLGANGAGKSTIVKIITGLTRPDSGQIELDGRIVSLSSTEEARDAGIAVVFQDPPLFPHLDVSQNVLLGVQSHSRFGFINKSDTRRRTREVLDRLGVGIDPGTVVSDLSLAECEFVAIARALAAESSLLVLDEPTAVLSPEDTRRLFDVVRSYCDDGGAVLFISHRMEEIRELADRITIFRDGRNVYSGPQGSLTQQQIIEHIMGDSLPVVRDVAAQATSDRPSASPRLSLRGLSSAPRFEDVTFDVYSGEVVALAGLVGSGRTEVLETIAGLRREDSGDVHVDGERVGRRTPHSMLRLGVALVPEDRDTQGLVYGFSVADNIALGGAVPTRALGLLHRSREEAVAADQTRALAIRTPDVHADVATLSGGNRQKVVLGKWLATDPHVLLLDEPTKGVDVGAKAEIHQLLRRLAREEKLAVLVVSSDIEEVLEVADRILVMRSGGIVAELERETVTDQAIMTAASYGTASHQAATEPETTLTTGREKSNAGVREPSDHGHLAEKSGE